MKNIFRKIIPENWFYKLVSTFLGTSLSFYIFKLISGLSIVETIRDMNEDNYIRTFLFIQFLVMVFFYVLLPYIIKTVVLEKIRTRVNTFLIKIDSREKLKNLSHLKKSFIIALMIPIRFGILSKEDFSQNLGGEENEQEINDVLLLYTDWICVIFNGIATLIFVYKFSAWYLLPILLVIFALLLVTSGVMFFVIKNDKFVEKVRIGLLKH